MAVCIGIGICAMPAQAAAADYPALDAKVYDRAAQYLASNQDKLVLNA